MACSCFVRPIKTVNKLTSSFCVHNDECLVTFSYPRKVAGRIDRPPVYFPTVQQSWREWTPEPASTVRSVTEAFPFPFPPIPTFLSEYFRTPYVQECLCFSKVYYSSCMGTSTSQKFEKKKYCWTRGGLLFCRIIF